MERCDLKIICSAMKKKQSKKSWRKHNAAGCTCHYCQGTNKAEIIKKKTVFVDPDGIEHEFKIIKSN